MTKEEFKELLEKLENNNFVESSLEIFTDFFDSEAFDERIGNKEAILLIIISLRKVCSIFL